MSKDPKFGALMDIAKGLDQRGEKGGEPLSPEPPTEPETIPTLATPSYPPLKPAVIAATPAKVERKLVTTRLPVDLHKRLKRFSLERERNIEDILEELIEAHLSSEGF